MWPVINLSALIGGTFVFQKNPLQDLLSSLNAVSSTNESTWFITGHTVYNLAYTYTVDICRYENLESLGKCFVSFFSHAFT